MYIVSESLLKDISKNLKNIIDESNSKYYNSMYCKDRMPLNEKIKLNKIIKLKKKVDEYFKTAKQLYK